MALNFTGIQTELRSIKEAIINDSEQLGNLKKAFQLVKRELHGLKKRSTVKVTYLIKGILHPKIDTCRFDRANNIIKHTRTWRR